MTPFLFTNSKGQEYYLNQMDVKLRNGRHQLIYFFSRNIRKTAVESIPEGMEVVETLKTGMPVLRKIR